MDSELKHMYRDFSTPPASCTQIPFWFLNGPVDGKEYARQIEAMQSKGVKQAMPHPRFGMDRRDYLTPRYWAAMKELLDRAAEIGFTIHLYDEFNWSSGPAGGKVTAELKNCALAVGMRSKRVDGPATARIDGWEEGFYGWGRREDYLSIVLMPVSQEDGMSFEKSLRPPVPSTDIAVVDVDVPAGTWEVMAFYTIRTVHPSPLKMDNGGIVDYLSPGPTSEFIRLTHEEYAKRFGKYFGNVIESIFYDESAPYAAGPFTWSETFAEDFARLKGYDIIPLLPLLFHTLGETAEKVRCDYWEVVSTLFTDNFIGLLADWSAEHGIALTGHTHEEPERWMLAADPYRTLRRQHWPGFDSLYGYRKYSEFKLAASVPHVTGGKVLLCEALGCMDGWSASPRNMKRIYNQLAVVGVTHMVPHAFFQTVDNPKVECPPSYFEHNLYWNYYEVIAGMTARQCWMNRQGVHVAEVAVLYPIVSWWGDSAGGRGNDRPWGITNRPVKADMLSFEEIIDGLMADQLDLDVLDSRALQDASVGDGSLDIAEESYKVLVVPPMNTVRLADVRRAAEFALQSGIVIVVGRWPHISMERGRGNGELAAAVDELKTVARFAESPATVPALVRSLIEADVEVLAGDRETINLSHRRITAANGEAVDVYLVNHNSTENETVELSLRAQGDVSQWDPESGTANRIAASAVEGRTVVRLPLGPYEAPYLVIGGGVDDGLQELPPNTAPPPYPGRKADRALPVGEPWQFVAAPEGLRDVKGERSARREVDVPVFRTSKTDWANKGTEYVSILSEWCEVGFDDHEWELVHCLREPLLYSHAESRAFRAPIPVGASAVKLPLPIAGEYALYVNGECLRVVTEHPAEESGWLELPECWNGSGILAVECASMAPDFGVTKPFTFLCEATEVRLQSWTELGLWWYSGFGLYRKQVEIPDVGEGRLYLNLGEVRECGEVRVNGRPAGVRLWPPYSVEITHLVKPGMNEVEVMVSNLLSNRFSFDSWGSRGKGEVLDSGLIGPVSVDLYRKS